MAYTTINKSKTYFNTVVWTGDDATGRSLTGFGFQPDLTWIKNTNDSTRYHVLVDAVRGSSKILYPNVEAGESTDSNNVTSFNSDGITVGNDNNVNGGGNSIVSWNWKANGSGSANNDGATASTVSVNTTAGCSIVTWTGTGSATTIGHGLGTKPAMYIVRNRDTGNLNWRVYHHKNDATNPAHKHLALESTQALGDASSVFNDTEPTNSVFSVGTDEGANKSGDAMIAYCFAEKQGYSKFGKYVGNYNTNGTFIYTGFKPEFVIVKKRDGTGSWRMFDTVRAGNINPANKWLDANTESGGVNSTDVQGDLVSNGIKLRDAANAFNTDGSTYIYIAFGQSLTGSNNVPCTAR